MSLSVTGGKAPENAVSQKTCHLVKHDEAFGGNGAHGIGTEVDFTLSFIPNSFAFFNGSLHHLAKLLIKKNNLMKKILVLFCGVAALFISCEKEKNDSTPAPDNLNGIFVINEGAFLSGNADISFFSSDSAYSNTKLFESVNGVPLGDVAQSMTIYDNHAYIAVNGSGKVEVVSMNDFKRTGTITNIGGPRYFLGKGNSGYISDWASNQLKVYELTSLTLIDSIPCGAGPEEMVLVNNKIFVCNGGGYGNDSTITVINASNNDVIATIACPVNPSSIRVDKNNKIWVLCRGDIGPDYTPTPDDAGGALLQIDPSTYAILKTFNMNYDRHPIQLKMNNAKDKIYFLNGSSNFSGSVYTMNITDATLPLAAIVDDNFYGLGIHPVSGDIYTGLLNFSTNSWMIHYNQSGAVLDSSGVGIGPNGFVFN
ncbi:hypothetical protein BH11BAC2_BH11BAC2_07580 [soil metagenome]